MPEALPWPCESRRFTFDDISFSAMVPDPTVLREQFSGERGTAPYWARIWPASLGLCRFLSDQPDRFAGKRVLELAAGLGLPGLLSSKLAAQVTLSDIDPEAVSIMAASVAANGFQNVDCRIIDWSEIPDDLEPELVLLSDVNYDPAVFDSLHKALTGLHQQNIPIILSTPQRLIAKTFIERVQPLICGSYEVEVEGEFVSVFQI